MLEYKKKSLLGQNFAFAELLSSSKILNNVCSSKHWPKRNFISEMNCFSGPEYTAFQTLEPITRREEYCSPSASFSMTITFYPVFPSTESLAKHKFSWNLAIHVKPIFLQLSSFCQMSKRVHLGDKFRMYGDFFVEKKIPNMIFLSANSGLFSAKFWRKKKENSCFSGCPSMQRHSIGWIGLFHWLNQLRTTG